MEKPIEKFILHLDILGFEAIALEIEEKTGILSAKKVRGDFLATMQERIDFCQKGLPDMNVHYEESDHWLIIHNDLEILLVIISQILFHDTKYNGYRQLPLEIAVGKGSFDEYAKFSGRDLIIEDEIISFLKKSHIIKNFKEWYKETHKQKVTSTYILLEKDCFSSLQPVHKPFCELIPFSDGTSIYQFNTEYILGLRKVNLFFSPQINKEFVLQEFNRWRQIEYPEEFHKNPSEKTPDTLFFCIIPSTMNENLIDLDANFTEPQIHERFSSYVTVSSFNPASKPEIWHYLRNYNLLATYIGQGENTKITNTPEKIVLENEYTGSKILIQKNGVIIGKFTHTIDLTQNEKEKEYTEHFLLVDRFLDVKSDRLIVTKAAEEYGTPLEYLVHRDLEHVFVILCFLFNPKCKKKMVSRTTKRFFIRIVLPGMVLGEIPRVLYEKDPFFPYQYRKYQGDANELTFDKEIEFEHISDFFEEFKKYIHGFFS